MRNWYQSIAMRGTTSSRETNFICNAADIIRLPQTKSIDDCDEVCCSFKPDEQTTDDHITSRGSSDPLLICDTQTSIQQVQVVSSIRVGFPSNYHNTKDNQSSIYDRTQSTADNNQQCLAPNNKAVPVQHATPTSFPTQTFPPPAHTNPPLHSEAQKAVDRLLMPSPSSAKPLSSPRRSKELQRYTYPKLVRCSTPQTSPSINGYTPPESIRHMVEQDVFDKEDRCAKRPFGPPKGTRRYNNWKDLAVHWTSAAILHGNEAVLYLYPDDDKSKNEGQDESGKISKGSDASEDESSLPTSDRSTSSPAPSSISHITAQHSPQPFTTERHTPKSVFSSALARAPVPDNNSSSSSSSSSSFSSITSSSIFDSVPGYTANLSALHIRARSKSFAASANHHHTHGGIMFGLQARNLHLTSTSGLAKRAKRPMHQQPLSGWEVRALDRTSVRDSEAETNAMLRLVEWTEGLGGAWETEGWMRGYKKVGLVQEYEEALMVWEALVTKGKEGVEAEVQWWERRWEEKKKKQGWLCR